MRAVVVYESLFGNTRHIAEAVADGLRAAADEVVVLPAAEAGDAPQADLLVIGGPTHVHGMSSETTRRGAVEDHAKHPDRPAPDVTGPALRDWIQALPEGGGTAAAAFDTRIDKSRLLTGSAAHGIAKRLRRRGYTVVGEEGSFLVSGTAGPLVDGEEARARAWAAALPALTPAGR